MYAKSSLESKLNAFCMRSSIGNSYNFSISINARATQKSLTVEKFNNFFVSTKYSFIFLNHLEPPFRH